MFALKTTGDGKLELVEELDPTPGKGEVLIRPVAVGICATDLEIVHGTIDPAYVNYPITIGHEWTGVVAQSGTDVTRISVGDRVVVQGIIPCERCRECLGGHTNRCEIYDEYGFTRNGAASAAVVAKEHLVHVLTSKASNESGALVEPAAVVTTGLMKANPLAEAKILVIGDGTIGLIAAKLARIWAPLKVDLVGIRRDQESLVMHAGVDNFFLASDEINEKYDLVIEASGSKSGATMSFQKLIRGGTLLILGLIGHQETIPVAIDDLVNGDHSIYASFGYTSLAWAKTVALLNSGELDLTFLVTHRFPLSQWQQGVDAMLNAPAPRGKVLLLP